jgi:peptidoglycan-associated lipoprotein
MKHGTFRNFLIVLGFVAVAALAGGCKKQVAATQPAPAPVPPAQPTVTLSASPTSVNSGGAATLSWSSTNATDLEIGSGVGKVAPQGSTPVNPTETTTYTITATGAGGTATASARVTVTTSSRAAAPIAQPSNAAPNVSQLFEQNVMDAYFDLDKADLSDEARGLLTVDAEFLRSYPQVRISIEGHCDERGSTEYNLGLGQRRADAAKNYLVSLGIPAARIETVSWGKERPFCTEHDEECWHQNRRAHFVQAH